MLRACISPIPRASTHTHTLLYALHTAGLSQKVSRRGGVWRKTSEAACRDSYTLSASSVHMFRDRSCSSAIALELTLYAWQPSRQR
ncbi:unnamed protein product [Trichogramma brassicae]|uniref:Uncharacterized protein n=1 Tax=Trichogramma brassicae TaxID=86971 RepID=A0A6H5J3J7_9HYME|nr:unnamed protein product [Trichogramma brassicae]